MRAEKALVAIYHCARWLAVLMSLGVAAGALHGMATDWDRFWSHLLIAAMFAVGYRPKQYSISRDANS